MTVLIPLLTALIYLGFYQHDKVWIANKTRTEAMEAALTKTEKPDGLSGVLACGNVSGGVKRGKIKWQRQERQRSEFRDLWHASLWAGKWK